MALGEQENGKEKALFGRPKILPHSGCPKFNGTEHPEFHRNPPYGSLRVVFTISPSLPLKQSNRCSNSLTGSSLRRLRRGSAGWLPDFLPVFCQRDVPWSVHEAAKGRLVEEGGTMN